jgi:hypothetical protein
MVQHSDALLRRLYLDFNRRFFNNELPLDTKVIWMPVVDDCVAESTKPDDGPFIIKMSPSISGFRRFFKLILIHEMCHIKLWGRRGDYHGKLWKEEIIRVLKAGAVRWL